MLVQVGHRVAVNFHHGRLVLRVLEQRLGQHAHARPDFEHVPHATRQAQGFYDVAGNVGVVEEVLAEVLFGFNGIHWREVGKRMMRQSGY